MFQILQMFKNLDYSSKSLIQVILDSWPFNLEITTVLMAYYMF